MTVQRMLCYASTVQVIEGNDMIPSINIYSTVAVYVQIENEVRFAIASGKIKAGDRLPSVREMSEALGVNPNTVAKSYRDLEVMGLLYTRRGMGVYVNKGVQGKCRESCGLQITKKLHEVTQEAKAAGLNKKEITSVVSKSFAVDASPYSEIPKSILALAKGKK